MGDLKGRIHWFGLERGVKYVQSESGPNHEALLAELLSDSHKCENPAFAFSLSFSQPQFLAGKDDP